MFFRRRKEQQEAEQAALDKKAISLAEEILSSPEETLKYLQNKFPNELPDTEHSQWQFGILSGQQRVINELIHLVNLTHK